MNINSLDSKIFSDNNDFIVFENLLESLNHTTPKKISRNDFNNLKWNFLIETWENKFGKKYDLFLPDNLSYWESLYFIDFLSNKFNLIDYTPYEKIISQIKVSIWTILREKWNEEWEKYLLDLSKKYNISDNFVEKIKDTKMNFFYSKSMIKNIKENRKNNDNSKLWENENDVSISFDELKILFWEEFDLIFFRKWINMLRLGMMTFTKDEYKKLKEKNPWNLLKSDFFLDEQERLLREKIKIDYYKEKLDKLREIKILKRDRENLELEVTKRILEVVSEFQYQFTENRYKPNKILETKELQCIWYSLIWHAFLSELWIKHERLNIPRHIALSVIIWWKNYYFDPTMYNSIIQFKYWNKFGEYNELIFENNIKVQDNNTFTSRNWNIIAKNWAIEKSLLSNIFLNNRFFLNDEWIDKQIVNNILNKSINLIENSTIYLSLASNLYDLHEYKESLYMYNKSIESEPDIYYWYYGKWENFEKLWNKELADLYYYSAELLKWWEENKLEIIQKKEKNQILEFISKKKYEELRLYLLSLEKRTNKSFYSFFKKFTNINF